MPKAVRNNGGGRQGEQGRNRRKVARMEEAHSQGDVTEYTLDGTERIFAAKIEGSWVGYFNNLCIKVRSCSLLITRINYSQIQTQCNPL